MIKNTHVPKILKELNKKLPKFPDGRIDYRNAYKAAVLTCFIEYKGKILLLKRSNKVRTYKELWNTVAGYIDELKPLEEKIKIELHEELNILEEEISEIKFGNVYEFTDESIKKTWIVFPALARLKEKPKIKINWEHTKYLWIDPSKIADYKIVPKLDETLRRVTD